MIPRTQKEELAIALDAAWRSRKAIPPLTETHPDLDVTGAYEIQNYWSNLRIARGDKIVGRKIGLTNPIIQEQLGVNEPDYGALWRSSFYEGDSGVVEIPSADFMQPRLEGEIAFLIGEELSGGDLAAEDVLSATEACALGVEVVDSRIADWRIKLVDTIADNASYGGFSLGPWDRGMVRQDLRKLAMTIKKDGDIIAEGLGEAALGHPAESTAWLANTLGKFGVALQPGDIVISGGITKMLPVTEGDEFIFSLTGQPDLVVKIA